MEKPTSEGTGKPTVSDKDIDNLAHGVLSIYEKPFKTIESQLEELLVKQNKIINTIQIINNNKDKNYKSKILILEEICARINDLIMQIKNNHVRMIEITKTVKTMKTQALKVKKYSLEQAAKHQEQLMKEQNLVAKLPSPS
ncbi:hypothetical protein M8J77_023893 [Diaphorina citri]|nr:hypothetical protein M8J77_023893 [Diaphorina citri]